MIVKSSETFLAEIKKLSKSKKPKIYSHYYKDKTLFLTIKNKKLDFDFYNFKTEKEITDIINEGLKILSKRHCRQLDLYFLV